MLPNPHNAWAWLVAHAAPLLAFAVALAAPWIGRGKAVPAVGAIALLAGWGYMLGEYALPRALWAPHRGAEVLLGAAAVSAGVAAALVWRGGRNRRLLLGLDAAFAGWWVAHVGVGEADFWRVGFVVLVLSLWLGRVVRDETQRGLAMALTLLGGLSVTQGGAVWITAAAVAAASWAGLLAMGKGGVLPAAPMAALIGAADLAGGRALRGRVDGMDLACVSALVAPLVAGALARRFSARTNRFLTVLAAVSTAGALSVLVWLVRRAFFG